MMQNSYRYHQRDRLPKRPAIYCLQERTTMGWRELYAGQSTNVHQRWNREGGWRHQHLSRWERGQKIMRLIVSPCWECNLDYREARAIDQLRPTLNRTRPKPRWTPLVFAEDVWRSLPWLGVVAVVVLVVINMGVI